MEDAFHVGEINQMQSLLVDFADGWGGGLRLRSADLNAKCIQLTASGR